MTASVDFHGDGTKVIHDRYGRNPVRIDIWAEYEYHPSGNVSKIRFNHRVSDDQTALDDDRNSQATPLAKIAGLRRRLERLDAPKQTPDTSSEVVKTIVAQLKPDLDRAAVAVVAARRSRP
jgi:hypothetical protein